MRKWLPLVLIFLAILAGIWFWSLGALPDQSQPPLTSPTIQGDLKSWVGLDRLPTSGVSRALVQASESLHSAVVSGAIRSQVSTRYLLRRFALIRRIVEEGKSGLAFQEFSRLETELKARTSSDADAADADSVREALRLSVYLYNDVGPDDSAYRIKQSLEDWRINTAKSPAEEMDFRLQAVGARLDEADVFVRRSENAKASISLDLARQSLDNIEREIKQKDSAIDAGSKPGLLAQSKDLRARVQTIGQDAAASSVSLPAFTGPVMPTSTRPITITTTSSTTPAVTAPTVVVAPTSTAPLVPSTLKIDPGQKTLVFGESVTFRAIVIYENGLTKDVTKQTVFTYNPSGYGALNGNSFAASQLRGTITITGTYQETGSTVQGSSSVTIVDKP